MTVHPSINLSTHFSTYRAINHAAAQPLSYGRPRLADRRLQGLTRSVKLRHQLGAIAIGCMTAFGAAAVSAQSSMPPETQPAPSGGRSAEPPSAAPQAPPEAAGPSTAQPSKAQIAARFNSADADADGKLTKEEARTSLPGVYDNFDRIDTKAQGFITVQDLTVAMGR